MDSAGLDLAALGSAGLSKNMLKCSAELSLPKLGSPGLSWARMGLAGLSRAWMCWDELGSNGLSWNAFLLASLEFAGLV